MAGILKETMQLNRPSMLKEWLELFRVSFQPRNSRSHPIPFTWGMGNGTIPYFPQWDVGVNSNSHPIPQFPPYPAAQTTFLNRKSLGLIRKVVCALGIVGNSHPIPAGNRDGNGIYIFTPIPHAGGTSMPISHPIPSRMTL